jgi:hypothetical protein
VISRPLDPSDADADLAEFIDAQRESGDPS